MPAKSNIGRILEITADGKWRSINVIKEALLKDYGVSLHNKGIGAQLRDIRKKPAYDVNVQKVKEGIRGTYEYQIIKIDPNVGDFFHD